MHLWLWNSLVKVARKCHIDYLVSDIILQKHASKGHLLNAHGDGLKTTPNFIITAWKHWTSQTDEWETAGSKVRIALSIKYIHRLLIWVFENYLMLFDFRNIKLDSFKKEEELPGLLSELTGVAVSEHIPTSLQTCRKCHTSTVRWLRRLQWHEQVNQSWSSEVLSEEGRL